MKKFRTLGLVGALAVLALLPSCATMPSFGPDADAITSAGSPDGSQASNVVPFEVIDVNAETLPKVAQKKLLFPAEFRSQDFVVEDQIIREGDQLEIRIWELADDGLFSAAGKREAVLSLQVSNSGHIFVPYAGSIKALGQTVSELQLELLDRYTGRAVEPEILVSVNGTDASSATIMGTVKAPGRLAVPSRGIRLLDFIAQAGGVSQVPWEVSVSVQRGTRSGSVSLADIVDNPSNNLVISPGDIVNVTHEPRRFAVYGGVNRSRNIEIPTANPTLAYLLAEAGGLNERVAGARSVFVFRSATTDKKPVAYRFDFSRPDALLLASDFSMQKSDITYVASADAADFQRFVSIILSPLLGSASSTTRFVNPS